MFWAKISNYHLFLCKWNYYYCVYIVWWWWCESQLGMDFEAVRSESSIIHVFPFNSEKKRGGVAVRKVMFSAFAFLFCLHISYRRIYCIVCTLTFTQASIFSFDIWELRYDELCIVSNIIFLVSQNVMCTFIFLVLLNVMCTFLVFFHC